MISKFITRKEENNSRSSVEFGLTQKGDVRLLAIKDVEYPMDDFIKIDLTEENLFDLIGQLLRLQSILKKEAKNG